LRQRGPQKGKISTRGPALKFGRDGNDLGSGIATGISKQRVGKIVQGWGHCLQRRKGRITLALS
jgi:hypothetical protein